MIALHIYLIEMSMNHTKSSNNDSFDLRLFQFSAETSSAQHVSSRGLDILVEFRAEAFFFLLNTFS